MKVSWFIPAAQMPWQRGFNFNKMSASSWIRCLQLIPFLGKHGIEVEVNPKKGTTDVAVFLRRWGTVDRSLAAEMKQAGTRVIVDTPVNYFSHQDILPFKGGVREDFREMATLADLVTCPSQFIADAGATRGFEVRVMEDSINTKHFTGGKTTGEYDLVWSGVSVKATELEFLMPALEKAGLRLLVIAEKDPQLPGTYSFEKWDYQAFPESILKGRLGVFPRSLTNDYELGHSFFKIAVFLAQGIPVVASPVPSYVDIMGEASGELLDSLDPEAWIQAIERCLGKNVSSRVGERVGEYTTEELAERYAQLFTSLAS